MPQYRRFQSAVPNGHGSFPGFFALLKGLELGDHFSPADREVWADLVRRSYLLHAEPPRVAYQERGARSWFRGSAVALLELAAEGCELLDRYDVPWVELRTTSPGRVVFEDENQVVAVPFGSDAWKL